MMKKNIFDLYNEQHPIQKSDPAELQGVVTTAEAASPVITNEAASSLAATVESEADPATPESAGADQVQESEDSTINNEGGKNNGI